MIKLYQDTQMLNLSDDLIRWWWKKKDALKKIVNDHIIKWNF